MRSLVVTCVYPLRLRRAAEVIAPPVPLHYKKIMTTTGELRQELGQAGIWMPPPARIGLDPAQYARSIEHAGFGSVWIPGVNAAADLDALEVLLSATERLVAATGIASVWTWRPAGLAARADALAGRYPGRFILGLGVSHAPLVESAGHAYVRPLAKMREFLVSLAGGDEGRAATGSSRRSSRRVPRRCWPASASTWPPARTTFSSSRSPGTAGSPPGTRTGWQRSSRTCYSRPPGRRGRRAR